MITLQAPSQIIGNESFEIVRKGCVQYVDGKPINKNIEKFSILGNIQPVSGRELLLVPEGDRFKEQYWVWTTQQLLVNDRLVRCKINFQVQDVQTWGSFYQCRIMRIDVGPEATP